MQYRASFLHTLIVTAPDDSAVNNEHRPDWDPSLGQALFRFFQRRR